MLDQLFAQDTRLRDLRGPVSVAAVALLLLVGAMLAAQASAAAFVVFGVALLALGAAAAVWFPRTAIVIVVLSPILDRYVVADMLPEDLASAAHFLSEGLLAVVAVILAVRAAREGRLIPAFRHPVTAALIGVVAIAAVSAIVNGVPWHVAALGVVFTVDAAALFFLPRLVGFSQRQALVVVAAIGTIVLTAAVLAILQALLDPRLLGMTVVTGRHGESARLGSFIGDPNVFGTFLVTMIPFALIAAVRLPTRRLRWIAVALSLVLMLALWLSFSRGAWVALVVGVGLALLLIDRRALLLGALAVAVTFVTADQMPRNLLVPRDGRPSIIDSTIDRVGEIGIGGDLRTLFVLQSVPVLRDHPLLGVGPGRFGGAVADAYPTPVYDEYDFGPLFWNPAQRTVDNFWLHLLVEVGVLGAAAFLAAVFIPGIRMLRAARAAVGWRRIALGGLTAAAAGMAISSGTTMLLEANSIGFLFWLFLGMGALIAAVSPIADDRVNASGDA